MNVFVMSKIGAVEAPLQAALQHSSRVLLMIAMALFLAYLLFLLSTVSIASAITTWHQIRRRPRQADQPRELAPATRAQELPHHAAEQPSHDVPSHGRHAVKVRG